MPAADADLDSFRADTRAWLEENCPPEMRTPMKGDADQCWGGRNFTFQSDAQKLWLERMAAKGWTVPDWPTEYGGGGLSREETKILRQEMARLGARLPLSSFGIWMLGPALLKYGTEAQKQEHLPPIARGEIRWCQGYSEPGAGSDLAGLQTRAVDAGDHYVINGQKVWTSYADKADWIFCLVRTNPDAPKHQGISFILFDMDQPGVEPKPIRLISGSSPFCETFFTDARAEKRNLVHEENKGWDVAKYLLGHEREMISGMGHDGAGKTLPQMAVEAVGADAEGRLADPLMRADIALFEVRAAAYRAQGERFNDEWKAGRLNPAQASMMKYYGTELNKRRNELVMAAGGSDALEWESDDSDGGKKARDWLRSKGNSIEGGTSEIQLNIVAKRILELPS
jgi:alkylation response protein AidB-like acyl-CoA dehydrogenase|tara:strand:- start:8443 stop:9636 length:1194 start_codon:yes stop_codon:yes gene_type:complete